MKAIITSLVFFISCSAMSQGLAKDLNVSKRMLIKDSLGQKMTFSDCAKQLNSKQWILHPEKNEQGKILYYLLKRTSSKEHELLSDQRVSTISEEKSLRLKRGRFSYTSKNGDLTRIRRRKNKQVEWFKNQEGSKVKIKYRIVWLDDASYILRPWNKGTEISKTPRYKISEMSDESYTVQVIQKFSLGPVIRITK